MATPPDKPMFPAVADALTEPTAPANQRPETTIGRPLLWAAAWGGLGALLAATAALIAMLLLLMAFLTLVAGVSETTTIGDVWDGGIGGIATLLTIPFSPELIGFTLRICAVSAVLSMASLLVRRLSTTVRRWTPRMQGLAATAATYAFLSAIASVLGTIAQAVLTTW